jgi:hypothetical protein
MVWPDLGSNPQSNALEATTRNITPKDCFGHTLGVQNDIIFLFIVDPPFVQVEESLYYVQTGNTVKLVCNVSSSLPLTSVEWEKIQLPNSLSHLGPVQYRCGDTNSVFYIES